MLAAGQHMTAPGSAPYLHKDPLGRCTIAKDPCDQVLDVLELDNALCLDLNFCPSLQDSKVTHNQCAGILLKYCPGFMSTAALDRCSSQHAH